MGPCHCSSNNWWCLNNKLYFGVRAIEINQKSRRSFPIIVPSYHYVLLAGMAPKQHKPMKSERVQAVVSRWILPSIQRYRERLLKLKLLPLSLHVEMHDLLLFLSLINSKYDIPITFEKACNDKTRQYCRGEYKLKQNKPLKSDENYFHRTKSNINKTL